MQEPKWNKRARLRGKSVSPIVILMIQSQSRDAREEVSIGMNTNRWELIRLGTSSRIPTELTITVNLAKVDEKIKKRVAKAIDRGFYMGYSGAGTDIYQLVCRAYGVPYAQVKREVRGRYTKHPAWRIRLQGPGVMPGKALANLVTADKTATRMMDDQTERQRIEQHVHWYECRKGWFSLYHLQNVNQLEEALRTRLKEFKGEVVKAQRGLAKGAKLTFRQED